MSAVAPNDCCRGAEEHQEWLHGGIFRRFDNGPAISVLTPTPDFSAVVRLGATITSNEREIPADDFFTGMFETALNDGELITSVTFPAADKAGHAKFPNPASRYAMAGVFVAQSGGGVRVAVTGAGPCVFRQSDMEAALGGDFSSAAIKDIQVSSSDLNSDIHASAEYRANLVNVMARRAVDAANG